MSQMLFKHGNSAKWKGVSYDWKVVNASDVNEHLNDGWLDHPDKLMEDKKEDTPARGRKKKAVIDESND